MPGWDMYDVEPPRSGEDADDCACRLPEDPERATGVVWSNERWQLRMLDMRIPIALSLQPRAHHDLADLPDDLACEMGRLMVAIAAAVEDLPSVGRCHVGRYGDGGAHLHPFFFGRPARMPQLRGSTLLDWEENLPEVPEDVRRSNSAHVGHRLVERLGGDGPAWGEVFGGFYVRRWNLTSPLGRRSVR